MLNVLCKVSMRIHKGRIMGNIILTLCLLLLSCQAYAKWEYDQSDKSIYTIHKAKDIAGWDVYVILKVAGDKISFSATVPYSKYKTIFTFNPPTLLNYRGFKLVRHDTFFWGKRENPEKIIIDGEVFQDFHRSRHSDYQIFNNDEVYSKLIKAFKAGKSLVLDKHYMQSKVKRYPLFSLMGFTSAYKEYIEGNNPSKTPIKEFNPADLMCKQNGSRKSVWINTSHGTYALNGHAMSWFKGSKALGVPLLGTDGKEWKMGRDYIDPSRLNNLIQQGLNKCK